MVSIFLPNEVPESGPTVVSVNQTDPKGSHRCAPQKRVDGDLGLILVFAVKIDRNDSWHGHLGFLPSEMWISTLWNTAQMKQSEFWITVPKIEIIFTNVQ
jgi:hypothetical protein